MLDTELIADLNKNGEYRRMQRLIGTFQVRAEPQLDAHHLFRRVVLDTYDGALRYKENDLQKAQCNATDLLGDERAVGILGLDRVLELHDVLTYDPSPKVNILYDHLIGYLGPRVKVLQETGKRIAQEIAEAARTGTYSIRDALFYVAQRVQKKNENEENNLSTNNNTPNDDLLDATWFSKGDDPKYIAAEFEERL